MKNYAYLVNVDSIANHNKFYEATQNDDMSIDVIYGRVGENKRFHHYRPYEKDFRQLIDSKLSKGYSDVTALHSVVEDTSKSVQDLSYQPIPEPEIQEFVDSLIRASNEFMKANYTVKVHDITRKMVDEAENDLHELELLAANNASLYSFNEKLQEIFTDIPRNMSDVYGERVRLSSQTTSISVELGKTSDGIPYARATDFSMPKADGKGYTSYFLNDMASLAALTPPVQSIVKSYMGFDKEQSKPKAAEQKSKPTGERDT